MNDWQCRSGVFASVYLSVWLFFNDEHAVIGVEKNWILAYDPARKTCSLIAKNDNVFVRICFFVDKMLSVCISELLNVSKGFLWIGKGGSLFVIFVIWD